MPSSTDNCPLRDHSIGKTIFATASHSLSSVCLRVTPNYLLSAVVTPALFSKGHEVHTYRYLPVYVTVISKARLALLLSKMMLSLLLLYSQRFKAIYKEKKFMN